MPETGIHDTRIPGDDAPMADFTIDVNALRQQEQEEHRREVSAQEAAVDTAAALRQLNERLDQEHLERIAYQKKQTKENRIWQGIIVAIGFLTLVATVLFGLRGWFH